MQSDARPKRPGKPPFAGFVAAAVVLLLLVWWQWDNLGALFGVGEAQPSAPVETTGEPIEPGAPAGSAAPVQSVAESAWTAFTGSPPVWPGDLDAPGDCAQVKTELQRVCAALDARDYAGATGSAGASCALLSEVAARLAARPPDPSLELRSYETMLGNVFHLFRVAGRERTDAMRRTLRAEQDLVEPLAMVLYRWAASREACARAGDTLIRRDALYAYAGFLFHSMGGQAYLRRRTPRVEALVSFYAVLILDRAERDGANPMGFDVLPEIRRTRQLLGAQDFVFGERYLALLGEIEDRRASGAR